MHILKNIAWIILLVPIVFVSVFGLLEALNGDYIGIFNLILVLPLLIVALIGRKKPFVAGGVLLVVSCSLALIHPLILKNLNTSAIITTEVILFGPPFIAGLIFLYIDRKQLGI